MTRTTCVTLIALAALGLALVSSAHAADPLPSWNETAAKHSVVAFVAKVTQEGGRDFVPPAERIATFDNDGTLWAEQPLYFQVLFALDRVKVLAPQHPEWKDQEPFASLLKGNVKGALAGGEKTLLDIVAATHTATPDCCWTGATKTTDSDPGFPSPPCFLEPTHRRHHLLGEAPHTG